MIYRSFKGNRKRQRTETAEGTNTAEGKKVDKEEKDLNGDCKEGFSKETAKEDKKTTESVAKNINDSLRDGSGVAGTPGENTG